MTHSLRIPSPKHLLDLVAFLENRELSRSVSLTWGLTYPSPEQRESSSVLVRQARRSEVVGVFANSPHSLANWSAFCPLVPGPCHTLEQRVCDSLKSLSAVTERRRAGEGHQNYEPQPHPPHLSSFQGIKDSERSQGKGYKSPEASWTQPTSALCG